MTDKEYIENSSWYKSVANAIRQKKGTSAPILRDDFASEIESISSATLIAKEITKNGTYKSKADGADGYAEVIVKIEGATSEEVIATPTKEEQEIKPSVADYISKVIVYPIPEEYVLPSGTLTVTENNTTIDVTNVKEVVIDVPIINSKYPKLNAPVLSLEENILTITDVLNGNFATSYDIYNGGLLVANTDSIAVDLLELFVDGGEYVITARANGDLFYDSEESNAVIYNIGTIPTENYACEVVVTVQNSADEIYWSATEIFADEEQTSKIGLIPDADGTTTVITQTGYIRVRFSSTGIPWAGTIITSGGVEEISHNDNYADFAIYNNGTITIDGWDFSY